MLQRRKISPKNIKEYQEYISEREIKRIYNLAKKLKGKKIIHINATPKGGGVAEILKSLVPLERSLGLNSLWYFINNNHGFFRITKKIHNAMQGSESFLNQEEKKCYLDFNQKLADSFKKIKADLVTINDPQPLAIIDSYNSCPMILRLHIDLSCPNQKAVNFFLPFFKKYQAIIFSLKEYIPKELKIVKKYVVAPAIDPLILKNKPLNVFQKEAILEGLGINPLKPLIVQVSRFDVWKNPLGVIKAFYLAKKEIPNLQLVLAGVGEAQDDPTAMEILKRVKRYAKGDSNIFLFSDPKEIPTTNELLINTLQSWANPVLQLSIREGFGLTVTEAMFKKKVVIGGNVGGIKVQIKDGINGFLIHNPKEAARRIVEVIKNPRLAEKIGKRAYQTVRKKFLITKLLKDHLKIYNQILR